VDIMSEVDAIERETGTGMTPDGEGRTVVLRRRYAADIADVWDALTNIERIPRWFLPVSGDLRLGGRYQFDGNAGGEILACEPPTMLRVSWVMGEAGGFSEVEVRLSPTDGGTLFEMEHLAIVPDEMWGQFGPGAVGVGWDGALLGLGLYLHSGIGMSTEEQQAWVMSDDARQFTTASSRAWGEAYRKSGASAEAVEAAVAATMGFYVPPAD